MCESLNLPADLLAWEARLKAARPSECSIDQGALMWQAGWASAEAHRQPVAARRPAHCWQAAIGGAIAASLAWAAAGQVALLPSNAPLQEATPPIASVSAAPASPALETMPRRASLPATRSPWALVLSADDDSANLIGQRNRALANIWDATRPAVRRQITVTSPDGSASVEPEIAAPVSAAELWREMAPESMGPRRSRTERQSWFRSLTMYLNS